MRIDIDDMGTSIGLGFLASAAVGGFGAYVIKPIFESISPLGVALTCGVTTAIALTVLFSEDCDITSKFIGFMAAYPIGLLISNSMSRVRLFDPVVSAFIGGVLITPLALTALFCATISADF